MKYIDILEAFETEIGVVNQVEKPLTSDSLFWLNQAVDKFVKLRFNTDQVHRTSYEQNEKRRNDLINLYKTTKYTQFNIDDNNPKYDKYTVESYPDDFLFHNEDAIITNNKERILIVQVYLNVHLIVLCIGLQIALQIFIISMAKQDL